MTQPYKTPETSRRSTEEKLGREVLGRVQQSLRTPSAIFVASAIASFFALHILTSTGDEPDATPDSEDAQQETGTNSAPFSPTQDMNRVIRSSGLAVQAPYKGRDLSPIPGDTPEAEIRAACHETGIHPDMAIRIAQTESSLRPEAHNAKSNARGLFQFTEATFMEYSYKFATELGFPDIADKVVLDKTRRENGDYDFEYRLADGVRKNDFMQHAYNGYLNAGLACKKMARDAEMIKNKLGIAPTSADIYATHFLGVTGGLEFLGRYHRNDHHHAPSDFLSQAAINGNSEIFRRGQGNGPERSVGQVMEVFREKVGTYPVGAFRQARREMSPQQP